MMPRWAGAAVSIGFALFACWSAGAQTPETVLEVRIHGNYRTPDADVLAAAGVAVGQTIDAAGLDAITARLTKTGRFQSVEIRKRQRSLTASSEVALIIIVEEFPSTARGGGVPGPFRRLRDSVMLLPTLNVDDGYGLTYGGRISFVRVLGQQALVTVPLTWGGARHAAVELDVTPAAGPVRRVHAGASLMSRTNPAYELRDARKSAWIEAAFPAWKAVGVSVRGAWSDVGFGDAHDRFWTYGAGVVVDTREHPAFPRNAIYAGAWWNRLMAATGSPINRYRFEAQAYIGLIGSAVLSVKAVSETSDRPLPVYEKALLGGAGSLRGFRAGAFVGDNLATASLELRIPLHSPMHLGQSGLKLFADAGTAYDSRTRLTDAASHSGVGIGWFVRAPLVQVGIDVAHGSGGGLRTHVTAGVRF
ncbi:MAG: BamA/TamA family outer membrane protein [Acidobacteriota bacterium]